MKMKITTTLLFPLLPLLSSALPPTTPTDTLHLRTGDLNAEQISSIAPKSTSCDGASDECATAATAAPNIAKSFRTYKVTSAAEQAAVIGLMAFESDDFRYNRNHYPGVAGQGTRNMQSPAFNAQYAAALPALQEQLAGDSLDKTGILDLLVADEEYDFGSGAWFLTTQCEERVRSELRRGTQAGWEAYIGGCVGTEANGERRAYWERAKEALGV